MSYQSSIFYLNYVSGSDAARTALTSCSFANNGGVVRVTKASHGLVTGACITVSGIAAYNGTWLINYINANTFDLCIQQAYGTMTVSGTPNINDTFVIDSQTFTFVTTRSTTGQVTISSNNETQAQNIITAIMTDIPTTIFSYRQFDSSTLKQDQVHVRNLLGGTGGNSTTFTANANGIAVSGSGTLASGQYSTYSSSGSGTCTPFGGSSWADAWQTITSGPTSSRIAPGDYVAIAKSSDTTSLGQTALWTNLSRAVVLQSAAVTANINLCETAWSASANVTATASSTCKEGSHSCSLAIAAAFTTGKVAYKALGVSTNFSTYQQVSFWIQSSTAIAAGVLTLNLCSDTIGATSVNTIAVPAVPAAGQWQVVTVDTAGALGSAIQSISVNALSDPGIVTILIDDILACKAASSADSLTLSSLISKNSFAKDGTEGFYGIQSINGTAIQLDNEVGTVSGLGHGYSGTTETVTAYKRETIKTTVAALSDTQVQAIQGNGTAGNSIQFQGGYNTSISIQDGETYFDGQNGYGYGIYLADLSYTILNYLNVIRYNYGIYYSNSNNNTITTISNANNNNSGIYYTSSSNNNTITTISNANNNLYGIYYTSSINNTITTISNANNNYVGIYYASSINNTITTISNANNNNVGIYYDSSSNNTITTISNANNNNSGIYYTSSNNNTITTISNANNNNYGIYYTSSNSNNIWTLSTSGNGVSAVFNDNGINYLMNALIAEIPGINGFLSYSNACIFSQKHQQTVDNHWIFTDGGTIHSQATTRHTASGIAWQMSPTSTDRSSSYPLYLSIAKIAVSANTLVTVSAYFYRDNIGITGQIVCKGSQIAGVSTDVISSMSQAAGSWEHLTITFTPSEAGVVEIKAYAYGGTSYNVYIDDVSASQV
jgi:hypothetical protein